MNDIAIPELPIVDCRFLIETSCFKNRDPGIDRQSVI
jgi:hypothetical protein